MHPKEKRLNKLNSRKNRFTQIFSSEEKSEDLLELHALNIGLLKLSDTEYIDNRGNKFIKTPLGFKRQDEQNLKTENYILSKKKQLQGKQLDNLKADVAHMEERKAKQQLHVLKSHQEIKDLKKQIGKLNKLLKEALDRNISFENKVARLENSQKNTQAQNEKLKKAKQSLLEQNKNLTQRNERLKKLNTVSE
ncbi:hypothetical protein EMN47_10910 [Prolixibacteraceae bacterium JC049]|nr:hypothetical protein [Prolixibacteraceae bacterium JC049]